MLMHHLSVTSVTKNLLNSEAMHSYFEPWKNTDSLTKDVIKNSFNKKIQPESNINGNL